MRRLACLALLAARAACAPKPVPPPLVTAPKFPDFMPPVIPASLAANPAVINQDRGWRFLQAGDMKIAERHVDTALKVAPTFYPADAGLGYVEMARKDYKAAVPHFDRALERE